MANATHASVNAPQVHTESEIQAPAHQAYQILHWGFVAAPVIAEADKFLGLLTNWDKYLGALALGRLSATYDRRLARR